MVDMTIGRSWGMGYFTDLVCIGRIFSQISLELEFFSPTYNGVRFCSALYVMSDIFSVQDTFLPGIYLHAFFLSKSVCRTFFLKSPITPSKVKWSAPKIHQTFGQLTDSDLSIISKGFWNNRGKNSQVERGGIRFYLPLPGKSVRSYIRITKFSRMGSLPNFITHGAPLCALRARGGSAMKFDTSSIFLYFIQKVFKCTEKVLSNWRQMLRICLRHFVLAWSI